MTSSLQLKSFGAFTDLSIDFSRGINIVTGENGSGTTAFKDIPHEAYY
ncbi:ATP-binding protein [Stutzerimonas sp. Brlt_13]|jgi:recombinational DNA repair ATPase RecF|uniref:Uncharacterized conserved protein n=1 Tax=Ectopseudomonas oleovorans TaxID=301 RepID=A0A379JYY9_ECTOL|nr:ATP-binding protein [Pseudomonas oleovorans]OWK40727.1 hypothetical protein PSOLE_36310 [Pseudomonas oleovorans subsp. oleovorans]SEJ68652.1 DNA repair protein RecN (Recombination protein N) [Pseudomonas oleovorans]SUD53193.1 Uncharacterized conserved protein [Pseudomonas oleovorans]|tara:strand:- start:4375 stop:4518 length:144 start_codon:yes stop_codon:yes gene_type:complete